MTAGPAFFKSSIGQKFLMAVSGIALFLFILGHLAGNLQIFLGQEAINRYAEFLRAVPELLWGARIGLIVMVVLHVVTSVSLTERNREARPVPYGAMGTKKATFTSRTMLASGLMIAAYVVYHLAHFTFKATNPAISHMIDPEGRPDVYSMMVLSFQQPLISFVYVVAMILLGMHLNHGIASFFRTTGIGYPKYANSIEKLGPAVGALIIAGYVAIPLAVLAGVVKLPKGGL